MFFNENKRKRLHNNRVKFPEDLVGATTWPPFLCLCENQEYVARELRAFNVLATLWRDKLHETFHSVTYPATAKIVARQVARAVAESRINLKFYFSCNLSCNDFGPCRVYYTVKCSEQLVPPQCRENIARQVARKISQCNSAFKGPRTYLARVSKEVKFHFRSMTSSF